MASYCQAGEMLGSRIAAKRDKCWVLGQPPSETNAGFSDCRQAGQILGSRTAAKREKCWVLGLPPSGHRYLPISVAEKTGRNPSSACGRGAGVRAFIRRMNLTQAGQTGVFCPPPSLRDTSSRRREEGLVVRVFVLGYSQAGEMLGSWAVAKREKCWVLGLPPSGKTAGFSDCSQAGKMLGSRTAAKREKCRVPGLSPSGKNAGFSDCRQAGQILGSRTAAKRGNRCFFIARQAALFRCFLFLSCRF